MENFNCLKLFKRIIIYVLILSVLGCFTLPANNTFADPDTETESVEDETDEDETDEDEDEVDTSTTGGDLWPDGPSIKGKTAIVMDADTGAILYEKKKDKHMYPASITKILTCLLTLENCKMDEKVTMSHFAVYNLRYGDAHIGLKEGETISVEECLYALMLASANEVAYGLSEHIGGSVEGFADMMNAKAKELGAVNSNFVNPNGLPDTEHYTTALDMALITKAALAYEDFKTIISTKMYVIGETKMTDEKRYANNFHRMLYEDNEEYYEGIIGGKTGYTEESGNTLVTVAERDGRTLICVVLNSKKIYPDTKKLLDFGFDNFKNVEINESDLTSKTGVSYNRLMQEFGEGEMTLSYPNGNTLIIPKDADEKDITYELSLKDDSSESSANASADDETSDNNSSANKATATDTKATFTFYYDSKEIGSCDVSYVVKKAEETKKEKSGLFSNLTKKKAGSFLNSSLIKALKLLGIILIIVFIICVILALRVAHINRVNRKRREARRRRRMEMQERERREQEELYKIERRHRTHRDD